MEIHPKPPEVTATRSQCRENLFAGWSDKEKTSIAMKNAPTIRFYGNSSKFRDWFTTLSLWGEQYDLSNRYMYTYTLTNSLSPRLQNFIHMQLQQFVRCERTWELLVSLLAYHYGSHSSFHMELKKLRQCRQFSDETPKAFLTRIEEMHALVLSAYDFAVRCHRDPLQMVLPTDAEIARLIINGMRDPFRTNLIESGALTTSEVSTAIHKLQRNYVD